jgi:hypothetical protein
VTARVSEKEWLRTTFDLLDLHDWAYIHTQAARRAQPGRWVTPVTGNSAKGWPDLFCVRGSRALALELKAEGGKATPEQVAWLERLRGAGIESHLIALPADWETLVEITKPDPVQMTLTSNSTAAQFTTTDNGR